MNLEENGTACVVCYSTRMAGNPKVTHQSTLSTASDVTCSSFQFNLGALPSIKYRDLMMRHLFRQVRDNILLGRSFNEKRYEKVLEACDLHSDIEAFPERDATEVGERGVLLSGGQRGRLAVARCLYSTAGAVFLDAPFASLDLRTANHMFRVGLLGLLRRRRRTVVLATDRPELIRAADYAVYVREGRIVTQGSPADVVSSHPELLSRAGSLSRPPSAMGGEEDEGLAADEVRTAMERWRFLRNAARASARLSIFAKQKKLRSSLGAKPNANLAEAAHHQQASRLLRRPTLTKRQSAALLRTARSQLRMNSSSQLNLCHDILLPSDECFDPRTASPGGRPGARRPQATSPLASGPPLPQAMFGGKRKTFARASSWSASKHTSTSTSASVAAASEPGRRHQLKSVGSSSSMLVRHMAAAVAGSSTTASSGPHPSPALSPTASFSSQRSPMGAGREFPARPSTRRKPPPLREFGRMRSFQHSLAAMRAKPLLTAVGGGSSGSLAMPPPAKHSSSEPEGFSLDLQPAPAHQMPLLSASRSPSRQSSYVGSPASMSLAPASVSLAAVHSRIMRLTSNSSAVSGVSGFSDDYREEEEEPDPDALLLTAEGEPGGLENREYGHILPSVYVAYLAAGGPALVATFLFLSVALQAVKVRMDFLLRDWSLSDNSRNTSYLGWYVSCSVVTLVLSCFANFAGQIMGARARTSLHCKMLRNLLRCPLDRFEACPTGRIINRFSYDMFVVDQKLPSSVQRLVLVSLICLSALAVNVMQSPWFIVFAVPALAVYWWLQHFYRATSRELQRLDSISRAPVLSHFSDSLGGLVTIRWV